MKLDAIQDLAGARIVLTPDASRGEQDRVRDLIVDAFQVDGVLPKVTDRRSNPSHGYRAVHVVAQVADLPVEFQIRTALQHRWAQYFEKLADQLGRGIRYGGRPERLDALLGDERLQPLREGAENLWTGLFELALGISELIDTLESIDADKIGETRQVVERTIEKQLTATEGMVRALMSRLSEVLAS